MSSGWSCYFRQGMSDMGPFCLHGLQCSDSQPVIKDALSRDPGFQAPVSCFGQHGLKKAMH